MTDPQEVKNLIEGAGGEVADSGMLPDGSGFMVASFPLPKDHWMYQTDDKGWSLPPPMPFRMGVGEQRDLLMEKVRAVAKYAVRASTMNGKDTDFDPDAMVQNFLVGMFGYHTQDGLSEDEWANPNPVPPIFILIT